MMKFLSNSTHNKTVIDNLNKELSDLRMENDNLRKRMDDYLNNVEDSALEKKALVKKNGEYKKEIETLKAENIKSIAEVNLSLNRKMNEFLATIGVSEFAAESFTNNNSVDDEQVFNKFQSLVGNERTEFYNKNKAQITRVLLK